jgi:hypothetical protein
MNTKFEKYVAAVALTGYIFLALFSLVGLSSHMHTGMPMSDCPYSVGTHSLCSMDTLAHIEAWEAMMRVIVPYMTLLIVFIVVAFTWPKLTEISPPIRLLRRPERQYSPYALLFSRGILNPKIP